MKRPRLSLQTKLKLSYVEVIGGSMLFVGLFLFLIWIGSCSLKLFWFVLPFLFGGFGAGCYIVDGLFDIRKFKRQIGEEKQHEAN